MPEVFFRGRPLFLKQDYGISAKVDRCGSVSRSRAGRCARESCFPQLDIASGAEVLVDHAGDVSQQARHMRILHRNAPSYLPYASMRWTNLTLRWSDAGPADETVEQTRKRSYPRSSAPPANNHNAINGTDIRNIPANQLVLKPA